MANDEHLHKAFSFFDKNQNGYIEFEELRHALSDDENVQDTEGVINAIMHDVDTDKVSSPNQITHFINFIWWNDYFTLLDLLT